MAAPVPSSALLSSLVESSEDAILAEDLDGRVTLWSPGAQRLFGYLAREAVGQSSQLIVPAECRDEDAAARARARGGHRVPACETVRADRSGRPIPVSLTVSPICDARDVVVGVVQVLRDVTERLHLEREAVHLAAVVQSS